MSDQTFEEKRAYRRGWADASDHAFIVVKNALNGADAFEDHATLFVQRIAGILDTLEKAENSKVETVSQAES